MKSLVSKLKNVFLDILAFSAELLGSLPTKRGDNFLREGDGNSDLIGIVVPVSQNVTKTEGKVRYSGLDWNARLHNSCMVEIINTNAMGKIIAVKDNVLFISNG